MQHVLGAADRAVEIGAALVGELHDLRAGGDHRAVDGVALDDLGVVLDADGGRQVGRDAREERHAADVVELAAARELVGERDLVDGLVALPQREAGLVRPAVLVAVEVLRLDDASRRGDGLVVDEDGGDARLLGLRRRTAAACRR